jgi:hypothetical protein
MGKLKPFDDNLGVFPGAVSPRNVQDFQGMVIAAEPTGLLDQAQLAGLSND